MPSREDLHAYQEHAVAHIIEHKRVGLFLDLGIGKTISTLTALVDLIDSFAVNKILIIAPLRVANSVWHTEAKKWAHTKHLKLSICTGTERQRIAALSTPADIYVINRENTQWLERHYKKWPFDCVVVDESSSFKNSSSQRFKALKRTLPFTNYMILLTGTPASNGLLDLWSQLYLIDFGQRLGRTKSGFEQRFFESDFMGYSLTPRAGAATNIQNLIADKCISMSADDYLQLPDRIDLIESIVLPPKALKAYKDFERTLFAELPTGENIEAVNAAVLAGKLLQHCNGAIYTDEHHNWVELHTAKLDALAELLDVNDENTLVAYNFKHDLARLQAKFPHARVLDKNPQTIVDWNAGKIKLLLAHPASAGHGLNLQGGGALIIWFGLNWSLELYEQFNARLHRQGQSRPVRVIHLVVADCLDERIMSVLADKSKTQKSLLNALKVVDTNL